jgi:hypothetical protein
MNSSTLRILRVLVPALGLLATACVKSTNHVRPSPKVNEVEVRKAEVREAEVQLIRLTGPAANPKTELSGMAWYGDTLVLLPQYRQGLPGGDAVALYGIQRDDLLASLADPKRAPLTPRPIPLHAPGLSEKLPGWEGFEAIAFAGNQVFLTVETKQTKAMKSYLIAGTVRTVGSELLEVELDTSNTPAVLSQSGVNNMGEEALVVAEKQNQVLTIHEANGKALNSAPKAHAFGLDLQERDPLSFPHVEYRITDASPPDAEGYFWAINYFYPGKEEAPLSVSPEPLATHYGKGPTHNDKANKHVERLLRFQLTTKGIILVKEPPLQLQLKDKPRNWEAIAVLEGKGLLLATDEHPETLLGFVPVHFH